MQIFKWKLTCPTCGNTCDYVGTMLPQAIKCRRDYTLMEPEQPEQIPINTRAAWGFIKDGAMLKINTPGEDSVHQVASLPALVVRLKNGSGYCADSISTCRTEAGDPAIMFVCSGVATVRRADEVKCIEWSEAGRQHCNTCDSQIQFLSIQESVFYVP